MSELVDEADLKSAAERREGSSPSAGILCPRCRQIKLSTEFFKDSTRKSGKSGWCKSCHTSYTLDKYREKRDYLWDLKSQPCADCGAIYHPYAMDLHHTDPSIKNFNLNRRLSIKRIKEEAAKCIVLCAVCHRLRHIPEEKE